MNNSPNPLDRFLAIPNRDAYATIRGFLYQAVLTIQAWLRLAPGEMLELESGEDIDWGSWPSSRLRREKMPIAYLGR